MLQLVNVFKSFSQGDKKISVLDGINLTVANGENCAIMGRSGSGKSTLLGLIAGLVASDQGEVILNDKSYGHLSENEMAKLRSKDIGFVFQNFHLVSYLNAMENVMLPARVQGQKNAKQRAIDLLTQVGLGDRVNHLPGQLSGGEKQRVALARALIHHPRLILADEPSGSLDHETGQEVMDILFDLVKKNNISLILVTHDPLLAKRCQKIYQIDQGHLQAC